MNGLYSLLLKEQFRLETIIKETKHRLEKAPKGRLRLSNSHKWEQRVKTWLSATYDGKEFQEGVPVILTEKGERVRSKSEKIMADYLSNKRIDKAIKRM